MVDEREGNVTYTFRLLGGDAVVDLALTRKGAMPRITAWVVLLLVLGLFGWRLYGRRI